MNESHEQILSDPKALNFELRSVAEELVETVANFASVLADWQRFGANVVPGDAAGSDWIDSLRSRTRELLTRNGHG